MSMRKAELAIPKKLWNTLWNTNPDQLSSLLDLIDKALTTTSQEARKEVLDIAMEALWKIHAIGIYKATLLNNAVTIRDVTEEALAKLEKLK